MAECNQALAGIGESSAAAAELSPAYRMRVVFESKVVAPYRDTYRGELDQAMLTVVRLLEKA